MSMFTNYGFTEYIFMLDYNTFGIYIEKTPIYSKIFSYSIILVGFLIGQISRRIKNKIAKEIE